MGGRGVAGAALNSAAIAIGTSNRFALRGVPAVPVSRACAASSPTRTALPTTDGGPQGLPGGASGTSTGPHAGRPRGQRRRRTYAAPCAQPFRSPGTASHGSSIWRAGRPSHVAAYQKPAARRGGRVCVSTISDPFSEDGPERLLTPAWRRTENDLLGDGPQRSRWSGGVHRHRGLLR